jgi:hypothetical protein
MPKPKAKNIDQIPADNRFGSLDSLDTLGNIDDSVLWDFFDPSDEAFWQEFFQIEESLEATDELDPTTFSISVQNQHTGETRTFSHIHLKSTRKKIEC